MRVSCLQENLAKGLSIVGRAVSSRSTLPILGNILLEAKNNQLRLAATNLEVGINCWIGAKVEDEGAITVPARLLTEFVNSLPADRIDMELAVRTQTLHLRCARYDANIKGIEAIDFPIIVTSGVDVGEDDEQSHVLDGVNLELETDGLRKMVDQVVFAASTNESQPTLNGVEVTFNQNALKMAATDGVRLSVRSVNLIQDGMQDIGEPLKVIVPAKSLGEMARISADADDEKPVQVIISEPRNQILFQVWGKSGESRGVFDRVEMVSQLISARFPDYNMIIPKGFETRTVMDTATFLKAVRVASLFARDSSNVVRMAIAPGNGAQGGQVRLTATSAEMGDNVNELDAMVEGDGLEICFGAHLLSDALSHMDQPQVVLETTQPTRPGLFRPVGIGEEEYIHIVMPMNPPG
ncbi:MAG: DNA polymerase III subunit beta [Caldilineaceae bacterium]|nr:DNA polymerase III subunit beta [Caldilineaceae bacterium]MCB9149512.1 DNA polymerase III subunit beta [Caldilineaceae bacterium]